MRSRARERKIATLVFADIVGYTRICETFPPEVVSALVAEMAQRLREVVQRHGGSVEKFAGDAMLAVFGVPVAHEDDPLRAVRAGLEIQSAVADLAVPEAGQPELRLRVGIETGAVFVEEAHVSGARERFVIGAAVDHAVALQGSADPGAVVVGPVTHDETRLLVDYRETEPTLLIGSSVPTWRVVAAADGRGEDRLHAGLETPFVGRDADADRLRTEVVEAWSERQPRLVTLLGEAGVGKSRLALELRRRLARESSEHRWLTGQCRSYAGTTFGPLADVVKADASIADDDAPDTARAKIAERVARVHPGPDTAELVEALRALIGAGETSRRPDGAPFPAWRHYLEGVAAQAPLVIAIEDIHWADDELLGFLEHLARRARGPLVILCLARHELLERRPGWGAGLPHASTSELGPLDQESAMALVGGIVEGHVAAQVAARAGGNPLFTEELARLMAEQHGSTPDDPAVAVPRSVQSVLAARLDALPALEKAVAQDAAVIGDVFWDRPLARLRDGDVDSVAQHLDGLQGRHVVVPHDRSTLRDANEYGFGHALIRDVAYESLPKAERAKLHREMAAWVERELAGRSGASEELVASHLVSSLANEEELGRHSDSELAELRSQVSDAAVQAARRAGSLGLTARACRWMRVAVDTAVRRGESPREIARLTDEDSQLHGVVCREADHVSLYVGAIEALERSPDATHDDGQTLARLRASLGGAMHTAGDVDGARAQLCHGLADLADSPPTAGRARLGLVLGWSYWRAGPVDEALPVLERAIADARACADAETLRWAMHDLGVVRCWYRETLDETIELVDGSFELAREAGDRPLLLRCYTNVPMFHFERGDTLGPIIALAEEGLREAREEAEEAVPGTANVLAWALVEAGRLDEAIAYLDEAVSYERAAGGTPRLTLHFRALVHRLRGEREAAEADEAEADVISEDLGPMPAAVGRLGRAYARWPRDPGAALGELAPALDDDRPMPKTMSSLDVLREAARMALRLEDGPVLERALEVHRQRRWPGAPALEALTRAVEGLVLDDGGTTIEGAAAALETEGHIRWSLEAWTDAALLAARAGRNSAAADHATAISARYGMHPLLTGPVAGSRDQPNAATSARSKESSSSTS